MNREEAIKMLRLMTEPGQDRANEAISVAVKALIEEDGKEKMNEHTSVEHIRTGQG